MPEENGLCSRYSRKENVSQRLYIQQKWTSDTKEDRHNVIISTDIGKPSDKIKHFLWWKLWRDYGEGGNISPHNKVCCDWEDRVSQPEPGWHHGRQQARLKRTGKAQNKSIPGITPHGQPIRKLPPPLNLSQPHGQPIRSPRSCPTKYISESPQKSLDIESTTQGKER